jgi:hypothetical protein
MFLEFWEHVCEFWDSVPDLGTLIKVTFSAIIFPQLESNFEGNRERTKVPHPPNRSPTGKVCTWYSYPVRSGLSTRLGNHVPLRSPCVSPQKVPSRTFPVAFWSDGTICWSAIRDGPKVFIHPAGWWDGWWFGQILGLLHPAGPKRFRYRLACTRCVRCRCIMHRCLV